MAFRKGVTPVIATVLLLTISVGAAASAYTFLSGTQKQVGESIESDLSDREKKQNSDLNIEYAYNNSNGFVVLNVRNTGSISLELEEDNEKIWSLYADGKPVSSSAGSSGKGWKYYNSPQDILDPNSVISINTTKQFPQRGESIAFRLVGQYGVKDSHVCQNSGSNSC